MPNHVHTYVGMPTTIYNQIDHDGKFSLSRLIHLPPLAGSEQGAVLFNHEHQALLLSNADHRTPHEMTFDTALAQHNLRTFGFTDSLAMKRELLGVKWEAYDVRRWNEESSVTWLAFSTPWSPTILPLRALSLRTDEPIIQISADEGFNYVYSSLYIRGIKQRTAYFDYEQVKEVINGIPNFDEDEAIITLVDRYRAEMAGYKEDIDDDNVIMDAIANAFGGSGEVRPWLVGVLAPVVRALFEKYDNVFTMTVPVAETFKDEWSLDPCSPDGLRNINAALTSIWNDYTAVPAWFSVLFGNQLPEWLMAGVISRPFVYLSACGKNLELMYNAHGKTPSAAVKTDKDGNTGYLTFALLTGEFHFKYYLTDYCTLEHEEYTFPVVSPAHTLDKDSALRLAKDWVNGEILAVTKSAGVTALKAYREAVKDTLDKKALQTLDDLIKGKVVLFLGYNEGEQFKLHVFKPKRKTLCLPKPKKTESKDTTSSTEK